MQVLKKSIFRQLPAGRETAVNWGTELGYLEVLIGVVSKVRILIRSYHKLMMFKIDNYYYTDSSYQLVSLLFYIYDCSLSLKLSV